MKRLWKSITLFAIANMIALAAPANAAEDKLTGVTVSVIYMGLCDKNAFTSEAMELITVLAQQYSQQERDAARESVMRTVNEAGTKAFCAAMTVSPDIQRAIGGLNASAKSFFGR
jgi:hypothetical protein